MNDVTSRDAIAYRPVRPEDRPFLRYVYGTTREEELQRVPWSDEQKANFIDMQFHAQTRHYEDYYPPANTWSSSWMERAWAGSTSTAARTSSKSSISLCCRRSAAVAS